MSGWSDKKPPRYTTHLRAAPRLREIFYCNLPKDAHLPEFWKQRPVIIVSRNRELGGIYTVLPLTTQPQPTNKYAYALTTTVRGVESWVICNHPMSVATSRLSLIQPSTPRITQNELVEITNRLKLWLPL